MNIVVSVDVEQDLWVSEKKKRLNFKKKGDVFKWIMSEKMESEKKVEATVTAAPAENESGDGKDVAEL